MELEENVFFSFYSEKIISEYVVLLKRKSFFHQFEIIEAELYKIIEKKSLRFFLLIDKMAIQNIGIHNYSLDVVCVG